MRLALPQHRNGFLAAWVLLGCVSTAPASEISIELTASTTTPFGGFPFTLNITIENAATANLEPAVGSIPPTGGVFELSVSEPTTFVVTANNSGASTSNEILIDPQPPVARLGARRTDPLPNTPFRLEAEIEGATSASIEPLLGSIDPEGGTFVISSPDQILFVLTATNAAGTTTDEVLVTPDPLPDIEDFFLASASPFPGGTATLTASIRGADSAEIQPQVGPISPDGGSFEVTVSERTTYLLTAMNEHGTSGTTVTVSPLVPNVVRFESTSSLLLVGETADLDWSVEGADTIRIEPFGLVTSAPRGTLSVTPTETTTYELRASNAAGESTEQEIVEVKPFLIEAFSATPSTILEGASARLGWSVRGSGTVSIDQLGPQAPSGSLSVQPTTTTTYVLRVSHKTVEETAGAVVNVIGPVPISFSWSTTEIPGEAAPAPLVPLDLYAVAESPPEGIQGYEFEIAHSDCIVIVDQELFPATAHNVGTIAPGARSYLVTAASCLTGAVTPLVRVRLLVLDQACIDTGELQLRAIDPSSFEPASYGFTNCSGTPRPFVPGPLTSLNLRGTVVPAVAMDVAASRLEDGIRLTWSLPLTVDPTSVHVRRGERAEELRNLVVLTGRAARTTGSFVDDTAMPATIYHYEISADVNGTTITSPTMAVAATELPTKTRLLDNVPNPFNPRTELRFQLGRPGPVTLEIYDTGGRRVRTSELGARQAGLGSWIWNGRDDANREVSSGVYYVRLTTGLSVDVHRMTLLR